MGRKFCAFVLAFFITAMAAFPQPEKPALAQPLRYSLTLGTGWTHYIDNLEYGNEDLYNDFAGYSFRFLWEPEYRLSLGAETGIYTLFKVKGQSGAATVGDITRRVTPVFLLARMRIIEHFYLGTGFGLAFLTNSTNADHQKIVTKTTSFSNYLFSASYICPISTRWQLGGEVKIIDFGAYNDWMYSLQVFGAFMF